MAKRGRPSRADIAARAAYEANSAAAVEPAAEVSEAVQDDASRRDVAEPVQRKPHEHPHSRMLEELVASRREGDGGDQDDEDGEVEPPEEAPATAAVAPAQIETEPAQIEMVTVKIDGQESQVPKSEVEEYGGVRAYQIAKAHEARLKEANETNAKLQAALKAFEQQRVAPIEPPKPPKPLSERIKEVIPQIQFGSQEEAAAALAGLLEDAAPKVPDQNTLAAHTWKLVRQNMAAENFKRQNTDIVSNPYIATMAVLMERDLIAKRGEPQDWDTFYTEIGQTLRKQLGMTVTTPSTAPATTPTQQPQAQATPHPTSAASDREARKASIVSLPTTGARAAPPQEEEPKTYEQHRRESLAKMRKARGLPVG